jgi:hypothetical protein
MIGGGGELLLVQDADGRLGSHDRDLGIRQFKTFVAPSDREFIAM